MNKETERGSISKQKGLILPPAPVLKNKRKDLELEPDWVPPEIKLGINFIFQQSQSKKKIFIIQVCLQEL